MWWITWVALCWLAAIVAVIAAWNARKAELRAFAACAKASGLIASQEKSGRSMASTLEELAEVRDAIDKGNALLKRIASRETMRDRRGNGSEAPSDPAALKAYLRQKAGIIAGKPAPHE